MAKSTPKQLKQARIRWRARKARVRASFAELLKTLGGRCVVCATTHALSIEHVDGKTYESNAMAWPQRVARYWREYRDGVQLTVMCGSCNSKAMRWRRAGWKPAPGTKAFDSYLAAMQHSKWIAEFNERMRPAPNGNSGSNEQAADAEDNAPAPHSEREPGEDGDARSDERSVALDELEPAPF